jgi:hypothetical protein
MRNDSLFVVIIVVMSPVPVPTILVPATPFPVFAVVSIRCRRRCIDYRGCRIDNGWRLVDYGRGGDIHGCWRSEIHANVYVRERGAGCTSR